MEFTIGPQEMHLVEDQLVMILCHLSRKVKLPWKCIWQKIGIQMRIDAHVTKKLHVNKQRYYLVTLFAIKAVVGESKRHV
jgi:hypothetical protein